MLLLTGKGGEGKSRVGIVLQALLGSNMKTGSIAKVENSPFARADLQNMLVMVDDDMKMEALTQTNNIKAIVTAELPMDLEKKGQQSYQGDLRVRFLAFGNGTLQALHDRSFGFFRRQIILEARERSPNRRDAPYLADKLCSEKEGIFLWALEGLRRLIRNDFQFTLSQRAKENMDAAVADGNNAVEFMKSQGYFRLKADSEVSSRDFYDVYRLWCEDNALNPLSQKSLTNYLNSISGHCDRSRRIYFLENLCWQSERLPREREVTAYQKVCTDQCYRSLSHNGKRERRTGTQSCHGTCRICYRENKSSKLSHEAEAGAGGCSH